LAFAAAVPKAKAMGSDLVSDVSIAETEESTAASPGMVIDRKKVAFDTGDEYTACRITSLYPGAAEPLVFDIKGGNGRAVYFDSGKSEWMTIPLNGNLPDAVLFIETDEEYAIVGPAVVYKPHGDGNLQDIGKHGDISAVSSGLSCRISISFTLEAGTEAHIWMLRSEKRIVEWNDNAREVWKRLDFNGSHRICYDGAYYISPSNYIPSGSGMYCRIPAVHPVVVLIDEHDRVSAELSIVLLEEALAHQNAEGYWPTPAESLWLKGDYGISSGFYDTRFNNDVTMRLFSAYRRFGDERYLKAALLQVDWLVRYVEENSFPAGAGILVEDYGGEDATKTSKTHCSLNHLLQEIKVLLTASELTGNAGYEALAELMLDGIRGTEHLWISGEKGLHYSIKPDMTPGGQDYPYLTYNDLYDVQEMLEARGKRDPVLDRLMASKLRHMLKNNITGYKTYDFRDMPILLRKVMNEFKSVQATPNIHRAEVDGNVYITGAKSAA